MRAQWMRTLYPQLENIVVRQDPIGDVREFGDKFPYDDIVDKDNPIFAPTYAADLSFLDPFDYVFSSEEYGEPFAKALGAQHVVVDIAREMLPISGTMIRENLYDHRGWVDPVVYRDLIKKIVFVGTESTGKSTLAKALADELGTRWTHEFGRELWEAQNLQGSFADMLKIATNQYKREQAAILHSRDFLFCDTNAFTTLQWSIMAHGTADERLIDLVRKTKDEYTWFLCSNDFGWVQDGTRELVGQKSKDFQMQNLDALARWDINYHVLDGSVEHRKEQVIQHLERIRPGWSPLTTTR